MPDNVTLWGQLQLSVRRNKHTLRAILCTTDYFRNSANLKIVPTVGLGKQINRHSSTLTSLTKYSVSAKQFVGMPRC